MAVAYLIFTITAKQRRDVAYQQTKHEADPCCLTYNALQSLHQLKISYFFV